MKISKKRREFCEHYLHTGNAKVSAEMAGFSPKSSGVYGSYLLAQPDVQMYLEEISSTIAHESDERIAEASEVLQFLTDTMRGIGTATVDVETGSEVLTEVDTSERLRAAEMLGKRYGLFIDRKETNVATDLSVTIDYGDDD